MPSPDRLLARIAPSVRFLLLVAGALAATLLSMGAPPLAGAALTAVALAALGAAVALYVAEGVGAVAQPRLGGRAQNARRTHLQLATASVITLFCALVLGALATEGRGLWQCASWPLCAPANSAAWTTLAHRGLAGIATVVILVFALLTWRHHNERTLRLAAGASIALMVLQNGIGLLQVIAAQTGVTFATNAARFTHLIVGALAWGVLVAAATLAVRVPWPAGATHRQPVNGQDATPHDTARGASDTVLLSGKPSRLKDYISLTKPGVISLLILTTITAMYITPAGTPEVGLVLWTAIGGWLMASGSHALNCYFDKDIDINMGRTSRRPIPSGRIPAWHAAVLGTLLGALAFAILWLAVNPLAALLSLAGLLYYVFIYTLWLKRTSFNNIVIGGGAGAFPPLVGWAAVMGSVTPAALVLWLIVFYWTPPHFWALALIRQKDYARAGVPMLPVVAGDDETKKQIVLYSIQLVALSVLPTPLGILGLPYLAMALALGAIFLFYAFRLRHLGTIASAWGLYKYSLLYLALLFLAMVLDRILL
jgi:protoheme IX farnesyltransferase